LLFTLFHRFPCADWLFRGSFARYGKDHHFLCLHVITVMMRDGLLCDERQEICKATTDADNRWLRSRFQCLLLPVLFLASSIVLLSLSTGCNSSSSAKPRPLTVEEQRGRDLFQANCAICHNPYKNEPLQGPPLVKLFRKQELPSGLPVNDEHVRDTILMGRRNMPRFNDVLDEKQINDLLAYLHTL
jgi:mono/diheme cytochrome c family protein